VQKSGYFGTFIYGCIERALIPFGLHHIFYMPFWQTGVGGSMEIGGQLVQGAQNIFFAQLADPNTTRFSVEACRFLTGKYPFMMGGLPGAALAMYVTARPEKRKKVGSLLFSVALTSFITGITEPIEFTFLFLAPSLFAVHVGFAGLAFMLCHILRICVGTTFSDGLIDLILYGSIIEEIFVTTECDKGTSGFLCFSQSNAEQHFPLLNLFMLQSRMYRAAK